MASSTGQIIPSPSTFTIRPIKFPYENENFTCLVSSGISNSNVLSTHVHCDDTLFQVWLPLKTISLDFVHYTINCYSSLSGSLIWRKIHIMAESNEHIELKFRIYDGTDIGHSNYALSTTVTALKQKLVSEWPPGKSVVPKTVNDIKIIHSGKVLENNKTLSECGVGDGAFSGGIITMHIVVQPVVNKKKSAKKQDETGKLNSCGCTIL
ncbi:hypothetical protein LXL04_037041 [Taraxacum kok-saghyz]